MNKAMKTTSTLKRTGFLKRSGSLKRSGFKRSSELSPRQKLDSIVSKCIRLQEADVSGMVKCVTCPNVLHWTKMDCGHFQKRTNTATRYDPKNLGSQCETCNRYNDGEEEKYADYIDSKYGVGTAELLQIQAIRIVHDYPYEEEIQKWTLILDSLLEKQDSEIHYN